MNTAALGSTPLTADADMADSLTDGLLAELQGQPLANIAMPAVDRRDLDEGLARGLQIAGVLVGLREVVEQGVPLLDPPRLVHVLIPRSDYTIVDDSWDVVGLRGTGSKDIVVEDAFIPSYRTITYDSLVDGTAWRTAGLTNPTYQMPFSSIFPLGITSAIIGICEGALAHHLAYQRTRVQITGTKVKDDPYVLFAISAAAEEIKASRTAMLDNVSRFYDKAAREVITCNAPAGGSNALIGGRLPPKRST